MVKLQSDWNGGSSRRGDHQIRDILQHPPTICMRGVEDDTSIRFPDALHLLPLIFTPSFAATLKLAC